MWRVTHAVAPAEFAEEFDVALESGFSQQEKGEREGACQGVPSMPAHVTDGRRFTVEWKGLEPPVDSFGVHLAEVDGRRVTLGGLHVVHGHAASVAHAGINDAL